MNTFAFILYSVLLGIVNGYVYVSVNEDEHILLGAYDDYVYTISTKPMLYGQSQLVCGAKGSLFTPRDTVIGKYIVTELIYKNEMVNATKELNTKKIPTSVYWDGKNFVSNEPDCIPEPHYTGLGPKLFDLVYYEDGMSVYGSMTENKYPCVCQFPKTLFKFQPTTFNMLGVHGKYAYFMSYKKYSAFDLALLYTSKNIPVEMTMLGKEDNNELDNVHELLKNRYKDNDYNAYLADFSFNFGSGSSYRISTNHSDVVVLPYKQKNNVCYALDSGERYFQTDCSQTFSFIGKIKLETYFTQKYNS